MSGVATKGGYNDAGKLGEMLKSNKVPDLGDVGSINSAQASASINAVGS